MSWVRRLALAAGTLLDLLALVLGVLVATFDAERATQVAVDWMHTHQGRKLAVEGPVALAVFPRLAVTAKGLRPSEAGRPDEFLRVDEVALAVRAWTLLRGQVAVDHVQARGVLAAWHRDAQGASNIDDFIGGSPAGSAPAGPASAPGAVPAFEVRALRKAECVVRGCAKRCTIGTRRIATHTTQGISVTWFFSPHGRAPASSGNKMSAVMLELAACALRDPPADSSRDALAAALMLAAAAWNNAVGDQALYERFRRQLAEADAKGSVPWAVLCGRNAAEAIALLVGFKNRMYPADLRRVVALEAKPDGNVRASWHDAPQAGSGMPAATPVSGPAIAVKPIAAPSLTAVPKASAVAAAPRDAAPPAVSAGGTAAVRTAQRRQPIADKLLRAMKRHSRSKVVDLRAIAFGKKNAEDLLETIAGQETLAGLQPAHAAYVYAQNVVSVLSEQLTALPEMRRFAKLIGDAEGEYMPSGPPMSPLTGSYFTCWAFFDACVGQDEETIGSVGIAVASTFGMHREVVRLIGLMYQSRMGIFVHQGVDKGALLLRELVTGRVVRAICPAGYMGQSGELWYARVLPPPLPALGEHVVFTTPYVLLRAKEYDWQAYFRRTLPDTAQEARIAAYERHMKFGPSRSYWNEFVFEAYHNYRSDRIYLTGVPDIPESLPHSRVNRGLQS